MTLSNTKHEKFAQLLADGMLQALAYSTAGYRPNKGAASRLANNREIIYRVREIQESKGREIKRFPRASRSKSLEPGFLYALTNESFPDVYKIGFTRRTPESRAAEISSFCEKAWEVFYSVRVTTPKTAEKLAHSYLEDFQIGDKELFKCSKESVKAALYQAAICDNIKIHPEEYKSVSDFIKEVRYAYGPSCIKVSAKNRKVTVRSKFANTTMDIEFDSTRRMVKNLLDSEAAIVEVVSLNG